MEKYIMKQENLDKVLAIRNMLIEEHNRKKTYRDKVAAAWLTGLTKVITVNNGYETRFDGVIVPKTKKVTVTYKYNTVTKESIYT